MRRRLRDYFDSVGISACEFDCEHYDDCHNGNVNFVESSEPYIGWKYESNRLPRLLFLSLDIGSADPDPHKRTMEASRKWHNGCNPLELPRGRHWYETHLLAWKILREFTRGLQFRRICPYFAHTNCVKCCQNNPGNAMASNTMFQNCRQFIPKELEILSPDILVTQGNQAKWVVECEIYTNKEECYDYAKPLVETDVDCCNIYLITIGDKDVVWSSPKSSVKR